jgi:hypothetical protein
MSKHLRKKKVKKKLLKIGDKIWFRLDFVALTKRLISYQTTQLVTIKSIIQGSTGNIIITNREFNGRWYSDKFSRTENGPPLTVKDFINGN